MQTSDRHTQRAGFPLRGLKGLWWEPEQYRSWPAFLERAGYDFFMLCYTFCPESGLTWRQQFRDAERAVIREVAEDCAARGITLCLAIHPLIGGQAWAPERAAVRFHPTSGQGWFLRYWQARRPGETLRPDPPIRYGSAEDLGLLAAKCRQAIELGVGAIALCLDDVDPGAAPAGFPDLAAAHIWLMNGVLTALARPSRLSRKQGKGERKPRLLVVPTYYWTDGALAHADYTAGLARGLPPEVGVFWTGTEVRSHAITAEQARQADDLFRRKPVVWLNYASNDSFRFVVQLPPDRPPAPDLAPETAGLLLNSTRQVGLARLDALVIGRYLADPAGYRHEQAVSDAVQDLVGQEAAPPLLRMLDAWRAVPDVRRLAADLAAGGGSFLVDLIGRLRPALTELDTVLPSLDAALSDGVLWRELSAGVERLRLLVAALDVLAAELAAVGVDGLVPTAGPRALSAERRALRDRLTVADPEAACDAEAVLSLEPATMPVESSPRED